MTARTLAQLKARAAVVRRAWLDAVETCQRLPRTLAARPDRLEWGLIRSACARELRAMKGQITKASRREGQPT